MDVEHKESNGDIGNSNGNVRNRKDWNGTKRII